MKLKNIIASAVCVALSLTSNAQRMERVQSPVINSDGSVTFTLKAPQADSVELSGQFLCANTPMEKGDNGIWSITVTPEIADIYPYNYVVDGMAVSDPNNVLVFPNENFKASLLVMPDPNALYAEKNVPRGKVEYRTYPSHVLKESRPLLVYLPAEYEKNPNKKYPVFYLVSGTTDTEETWYKVGRANNILDNMIASGDAEPMIVVMPYGYMNNGTPSPTSPEAADMYAVFTCELTECIMPYVEKNYRTINDRDHRALAGFSRGGGQSMFATLKNPDKFGWLGVYSAYLTPEVMEKHFPKLKEDVNSLRMCWFCVGDNDFLYNQVVDNTRYFDNHGIKYEQTPHPGHAHTWMHGRFCLAETAKRLFKDVNKDIPGVTIDNSSMPGYTIYRPTDMEAAVTANGGNRLPVFVFGNGACSHSSKDYIPMLTEVVNNGYIVMAVGEKTGTEPEGGPHDFSTIGRDDNLIDAVDWICRQNAERNSVFYRMVDTDNIAVGGHSCGGAQAARASYDPRISTTLMLNSGMGDISMAGADTQSLQDFHSPVLYLIGGPDDIAYGNAEIDFERLNHVPVVSANFPVGHGGTYGDDRGGVFGDVIVMWLDWQLKDKKEASRFFKNSSWRKNNYPQCDFKSKKL